MFSLSSGPFYPLSPNIPSEAVEAEQTKKLQAVNGLVQIVEAGGIGTGRRGRRSVGDGNVSYFF